MHNTREAVAEALWREDAVRGGNKRHEPWADVSEEWKDAEWRPLADAAISAHLEALKEQGLVVIERATLGEAAMELSAWNDHEAPPTYAALVAKLVAASAPKHKG